MTKTRKTSRFVALLLTMLTIMSAMFAFGGISASATASLSTQGQKAMEDLLTKEDISSNTAIQKYAKSSTDNKNVTTYTKITLGSKYNVPLKSKSNEMGDVQVFQFPSKKQFKFNGSGFEDIADSAFQQALINEFAKLMASDKYRNRFSDADRQAIYDEIKDNCGQANAAMISALFQDTKADMFSALRIFQPFNGIVGTILGVCVLALIILLIGSTALDMAYINFPIARNFMYGKDKEGGDKSGGAKKPWGVTADAWSVVNECEGGGGSGGDGKYKNANIAYFKRRIVTYIVVAIMILYLLSGQLAGLIGWLMNLVSGFSMN